MILTAEQQSIIDLVVNKAPGLACLTGGPGTGKTTTLRELLAAAGRAGLRPVCAAPSGKAAQRMAEATGFLASTLHRLMGLVPGSSDWMPIYAGLLVIDEGSMVDVPLMAAALRAAAAGRVQTVLLVGDADQLPPVGPGQPFHDLLAGGVCPTVRLTQVHRQAQESAIVRLAHTVVRGEQPELTAHSLEQVNPELDLQLVVCDELKDVPATCWGVIERFQMSPGSSQILAPQKNTAGGVEEICSYVERARWDGGEGPSLVRDQFRQGTKVINTKNDYELEVFNGEMGEVVEAHVGDRPTRDQLKVQIAGELKTYTGAAIKLLKQAWCTTVHRYQGSQADDVIVVCHPAHSYMLTRRLLYVAATRAAKRLVLVGQAEAVRKAVRNTRDARRDTWLGRRFKRDRERALAVTGGAQ